MKLQLIPILQHMHHDTATSAMVSLNFLTSFTIYHVICDLIPLVSVITGEKSLHGPTDQISGSRFRPRDSENADAAGCCHISRHPRTSKRWKHSEKLGVQPFVPIYCAFQVKLLVDYVANEPRWAIRMAALSGLYTLAKSGGHYWSEDAVADLISVASSTDSENITEYIFDILIILTKSPATCQIYYKPGWVIIICKIILNLGFRNWILILFSIADSSLMALCYETSLSSNALIAGKAVKIISQISCYWYSFIRHFWS